MTTYVSIDTDLLRRARALTDEPSDEAVVTRVLKEFIARHEQAVRNTG